MYSYVTYGVKLHNILMVLMEISLILELWIFSSRLIRSAGLKKIMRIEALICLSHFVSQHIKSPNSLYVSDEIALMQSQFQ